VTTTLAAAMRPAAVALAFGLALLLSGCGAGLVAGVASSERNGGGGEPPPELSLSPVVPLVPAPNTTRGVVVANARIDGSSALRVRIDAAGVGVDQGNPTVTGQGGSTLVAFTVVTAPIRAAIADPTAADVPAQLSVFVDGRLVASPVPIVLARQPRATLVLDPPAPQLFLSPLGQRVRVRVDGLRATAASDVQLLVTTPDPDAVVAAGQPRPRITRVGTDVRFEGDGALPELSAFVPGNTFPVRAELVVRDAIAGESTVIGNAFYRPEIALALPAQGPTTGGSVLTLIGTAMMPFDFAAPTAGAAPFAFDAVELAFAKNGRVTALPRQDFRTAESGRDRLVFTMPAAPDGRPGQVDIVLRTALDGVVAEFVASQVFLFANPDPFFGPLGIVLDQLPVTVAPIALDQAPSTSGAPDFVALTDQGGVGFLQLLLSQQNGMFQPFAAPRQLGNHEAAEEREPRDLGVGDFDGDDVPDVLLVNAGAGIAVHHLVLGQRAPLPPLGAVHRFTTPGGMHRVRVARLDGDALPDLLLVPGPLAAATQQPLVMLARPAGPGQPQFTAPVPLPVRSFPYEAIEVADLDGDGALDVAVVSGVQGKLDVAYGSGDGSFALANVDTLDFTVPNYTFDPQSPAVGLHACADGTAQSLALVLSGLTAAAPTPPTLARLRQVARHYLPPTVVDTVFASSVDPIGRSLAAELDGQAPLEIVVAMRDAPLLVSLVLLRVGAVNGFQIVDGGVEGGAESPREIKAIAFDRAFPDSGATPGRKAVFLVHETVVDGATERRLSTRLVDVGPGTLRLLPPDIGGQVEYAIHNVVTGDFPAPPPLAGPVRGLALARTFTTGDGAIELVASDGAGGLPTPTLSAAFPGLLPGSLTLVPGAAGAPSDALVAAGRDSRLGVWRPGSPPQWSAPLRDAVADPLLQALDLTDATRIHCSDVDGDGIDDLVVLLRFALPDPVEGQAAIALLRGIADPGEQFPFTVPVVTAAVHGNSSSVALADFVRNGVTAARVLELAVAVPEGAAGGDGNHVRFFRYAAGSAPEQDRFVPATAGNTTLLAGSEPTQLAAADFDRDGSQDLLVACRGDSSLRLYRNAAPVTPGAVAVDVAAFTEALGSPWLLAQDVPTILRLSDVNGDGNLDAVAWVEDTVGAVRTTSVAVYLSSGGGAFDGPRPLSPTRIGNRNARLSGDLGDWNRDGVPDAFLGWSNSGNINLRVLFGGTR
jgi:hypothetical protein